MPALLLACAFLLALAGCGSQPQVAVRDTVDDYSWEELAAISAEIAAAPDDAAAKELAEHYHVAGAGGSLDGSQSKAVELADGSATRAIVIGFNQDVHDDGGKAGMTFMLADAVDARALNNGAKAGESDLADAYSIGGWAASDARRWLNGDFRSALPADLDAVLAPVQKAAVAVPEFELGGVGDQGTVGYSPDAVLGATVDYLWLPAISELSGVSPETVAATDRPGWVPVLRAEGGQYRLFADEGISEEQPNDTLKRSLVGESAPGSWWLRSVENASFAYVREDGSIDREDSEDESFPLPSEALGIVPCFAL